MGVFPQGVERADLPRYKAGMDRKESIRFALDLFFPATILGLLGLIAVGTASRGDYDEAAVQVESEKVQIERAQFMLECVADWQYKPDTCAGILHGDLPPTVPDAMEPGC